MGFNLIPWGVPGGKSRGHYQLPTGSPMGFAMETHGNPSVHRNSGKGWVSHVCAAPTLCVNSCISFRSISILHLGRDPPDASPPQPFKVGWGDRAAPPGVFVGVFFNTRPTERPASTNHTAVLIAVFHGFYVQGGVIRIGDRESRKGYCSVNPCA